MVAVLICFASVPAFAEDVLFTTTAAPYDVLTANAATISLVLAEEASASSAKAGETVEISVAAEQGIPGLYAMEFTVGFDAAKFAFVACNACDALNADGVKVNYKATANSVIVRVNAYETVNQGLYTADKTELVKITLTALKDMDKFDGVVTLKGGNQASKNGDVEVIAKSIISVVYGDVNADGNVGDIFDLLTLKKYLSDSTVAINVANADVTADGSVDVTDLVRLKKFVAGVTGTVLGPKA